MVRALTIALRVGLMIGLGWAVPESQVLAGTRAGTAAAPQATTFVVNTLSDLPDPAPGDGVCEASGDPSTCALRAAIMEANAWPGADTITFSPGLPTPAIFPLTRSGDDDTTLYGDLDITSDLTIVGRGADQTIIDGWGYDRVLHLISGYIVLTELTIRNGRTHYPETTGGGIHAAEASTAMLTRVSITGNTAVGITGGGGISNRGAMTVLQSTITGNFTEGKGGGLDNFGWLRLDYSSVSGNVAESGAGGLLNRGAMIITHSTINANSATTYSGGGTSQNYGGGGIQTINDLTVWNSTIDGNTTYWNGGAISNGGTGQVNLYNVTIAHNVADYDDDGTGTGGGVFNAAGATFNTRNTLLAVNYRGITPALHDCSGAIWSDHSRFTSIPAGCSIVGPSYFATDPNGIGPLADNGGPTLTVALLPGSDAIDAADQVQGCVNMNSLLLTDQRGAPRVAGARCDVGAYEFGALLPRLFLPLVIR